MEPNNRPNARSRVEKGRHCWSTEEERMLIVGLKEIILTGWKSDNGFQPGYLTALETFMSKAFPGTDLKGNPHINSKIHGWKKQYGRFFSMIARSGIGFNNTTKMIEADNDAWASFIKVDAAAKQMRFKSWPYYDDWCEIFGKDRATGESVEGFVDAVNSVLNDQTQQTALDEEIGFEGLDGLFEGLGETGETMSGFQPSGAATGKGKSPMSHGPECQPTGSASGKGKAVKKRKAAECNETVCDLIGKFCETTGARLGDTANRIGYEQDVSNARKEVFAFVDTIEGMNLNEKLLVSKRLVKEMEDLELFSSLPTNAKEMFAKMKLAGHL